MTDSALLIIMAVSFLAGAIFGLVVTLVCLDKADKD